LAYAIHEYFQQKGFVYLHTPIITASDAEGAGQMFRVTTLPPKTMKLVNKSYERAAEDYRDFIFRNITKEEVDKIDSLLKEKVDKGLSLSKILTESVGFIDDLTNDNYAKKFTSINFVFDELYSKLNNIVYQSINGKDYFSEELERIIELKKPNAPFSPRKPDLYPYLKLSFFNIEEIYYSQFLDPYSIPDYKYDFFAKPTNLTVSGQLEAELGAMALSEVYTFGPTFRAENSNTTRHLAEFWMIEPEVAFNDLHDNMDLAEGLLKFCIQQALTKNADDLEFLNQRLAEEENQKPTAERSELGLLQRLNFCVENDFVRLTYTEAIDILKESNHNKKKKFQYLIEGWGVDLQSEHERYLVEKHFKKPVILTDYPKDIKAFYMRQNDDGKTVRAMDILFPGIGEIVGGSQREERLELLEKRMDEMHIPKEEMYWYLDTRRFGTCPHAGFGLGFERLVLFVTGMGNIRDVIPFPRFPKSAEF
jgi:aspartyl/asparaginyl-tRNA synthetase